MDIPSNSGDAEAGTSPEPRASDLGNGVWFDWLANGQIASFRLLSASRPTVDTWVHEVSQIIQGWPGDQPYLVMHDFSAENVGLTPYAKSRIAELYPLRPDLRKYIADILPRGLTAQVAQFYVNRLDKDNSKTRIFFDSKLALTWLSKQLQHT